MSALIQHRETSGTSAGALTNGTHEITRTLNTLVYGFVADVTADEDGVTFTEDRHVYIRATAPVNVNGVSQLIVRHKGSDGATIADYPGHSGYRLGDQQDSAPTMNHRDTVTTPPFMVRAGETVEIVHLIHGSFAGSDGLGAPANRGNDEVYTEVEIFEV
jgi:hypothetical protein